jgi:hypothetical protein
MSRQIVQYDTRPLVSWSDSTPVSSPNRKAKPKPTKDDRNRVPQNSWQGSQPFPVDKLGMPRQTPDKPSPIPFTPPPEEDTMDWTPSLKQDIRPKSSAVQDKHPDSFSGKLPFYGSLPEAPRPPSWQLRNPTPQRPVENVVQPNPFRRAPMQQENRPADKESRGSDAHFAPPKFFPPTDYNATTGLETLFDQAFTIRSPDDEPSHTTGSDSNSPTSIPSQRTFVFQCLRLSLLVACLVMWKVSQMELVSIPGNYVEITALGSASLIAGLALLEILKRPMDQWNSMEILVFLAELALAIHLGGNLPQIFYERKYFDRYGKGLLVFMSVQEVIGLVASHRQARSASTATVPESTMTRSLSLTADHSHHGSQTLSSTSSSPPPLSFSSTLGGSSFSQPSLTLSQSTPPNYALYRQDFFKDNDSDASDASGGDSDAETTVTSTTNRTIRHMNPFTNSSNSGRTKGGLGSGLQGLSLDDGPGRQTRSQAPQASEGDVYRRYSLRRRG